MPWTRGLCFWIVCGFVLAVCHLRPRGFCLRVYGLLIFLRENTLMDAEKQDVTAVSLSSLWGAHTEPSGLILPRAFQQPASQEKGSVSGSCRVSRGIRVQEHLKDVRLPRNYLSRKTGKGDLFVVVYHEAFQKSFDCVPFGL